KEAPAAGRVRGALTEAVVAETVVARGAERAARAPALPPGGGVGVQHDRVAALGTGARVQAQGRAARLGPLDKAERAVAAVMRGAPQPIGRAVVDVGVQIVAPVVLCRERRRGGRTE